MPHTPRLAALANWSAARHGLAAGSVDLQLAAGDASFRRYYRLSLPDGTTRMLMDAPPVQEDSAPFLRIAEQWRDAGLPVPRVHAADLEQGFLELDDLGDAPLNAQLSDTGQDAAYAAAASLLDALQNQAPLDGLPAYDADLLGRELDLFPDWCLARVVDLAPPPQWPAWRQRLIEMALAQPRVAVHRDFDAMNLMCHRERLYVIDFQDAVAGPLSYDLISLLRGRYRRFDLDDFERRCEAFRQRALGDGRLPRDEGAEAFRRQVDAMAAQRCLKVLGIFCRLTLRDGKAGYLARLPHFVAHLEDSLAPHAEFAALADWLQGQFDPALTRALQAHGVEVAY